MIPINKIEQGTEFINQRLKDKEFVEKINGDYSLSLFVDDSLKIKLGKINESFINLSEKRVWSDYYSQYIYLREDVAKTMLAQDIAGIRFSSVFFALMNNLELV